MRRVVAALLAALLVPAAQAQPAKPLPAALFFQPAESVEAALSPSGTRLALTTRRGQQRIGLLFYDLQADGQVTRPVQFNDADVTQVAWVSDERLVFSAVDYSEGSGRPDGAPGLIAINHDGSDRRLLIKRRHAFITDGSRSDRSLSWDHALLRAPALPGNTEVLIAELGRDAQTPLWLDTVSGRTRRIAGLPAGGQQWISNSGGEPRAVVTRDGAKRAVWWRPPGRDDWERIAEGDLLELPFLPHSVDADGRLYVTQRSGAGGVAELKRYDPARGAPSPEPLVSTPGFDFRGQVLRDEAGDPLGVRVNTDAEQTVWQAPALKALQAQIDKMLPTTINRLSCRRCGSGDAVALGWAFSDTEPGRHYVYRAGRQPALQLIAASQPWIQPSRMAGTVFQRITARDGRDLPLWLTLPADFKPGGAPRAAVVLVHGGPWVRGGDWRWRAMPQFLASRGYLVIEPEYRGSTGYGEAHFKAGWKQWGLAMQDDVADALRWAQQQGLASDRACIAGGSYGGYSTLMGLVRDPGLYRCGIAWVAVSDLELLLEGSWLVDDDTSGLSRRHTLPEMIGDVDKDRERIRATSPLRQVERIKAPLLLAMGELDRRVPLAHGKRLRDALTEAGNPPQWVVYDGEAHGWATMKHKLDFAQRVERFLADQLLGNAAD